MFKKKEDQKIKKQDNEKEILQKDRLKFLSEKISTSCNLDISDSKLLANIFMGKG